MAHRVLEKIFRMHWNINSNKYAVLPSIAAAWLISSEKFVKGKSHRCVKAKSFIRING